MGIFKVLIILGILIFGYMKLVPESSRDDIEEKVGYVIKEKLEDEETNLTIQENSTNSSLEKRYLGKPQKVLEFPCESEEDCVDSYCDLDLGECYIYE